MKPYEQGYKDAVRHAYEAAGLAVTIPIDEDILFAHMREMRKYRQGYESMQHERDHARECERKANDRQAVLAMERNDLLNCVNLICGAVTGHAPRELCTTVEAAEWLVDRHKAATAATLKLDEIRTEKLAAKGLGAEASAVSAARVILLKSKRVADETADGKPDGQEENVAVELPPPGSSASKLDSPGG